MYENKTETQLCRTKNTDWDRAYVSQPIRTPVVVSTCDVTTLDIWLDDETILDAFRLDCASVQLINAYRELCSVALTANILEFTE